jgi:transposase-like protein
MEEGKMQCPECKASHIHKNGINKKGKQNNIFVYGRRQFIGNHEKHRDYDKKMNKECLTMYVNGIGFTYDIGVRTQCSSGDEVLELGADAFAQTEAGEDF